MHGGGVAGRDPRANASFIGQRGDRLHKAGLLIVDFITMNIQRTVVFLRQVKSDMQGLHAVFPGEFEVRDGTHHIRAQR